MKRKTFLKASFAVFVGLIGVAVYQVRQLNVKKEKDEKLVIQQAEQIQDLQKRLGREKKKNMIETQAQREVVNQIHEMLLQEQNASDAAHREIQIAKNKGSGEQDLSLLQNEVKAQRALVNDLARQLNAVKTGKAQMDSQTRSELRQVKSAEQQDLLANTAELSTVEQTIRDLNEQIHHLKKHSSNFNDQAQLAHLQSLLAENQHTLKALKNQRILLKQKWENTLGNTRAQSSQTQIYYQSSATDSSRDLNSAKLRLQALEQDLSLAKQGKLGQLQSLQQLETIYETHQSKIQQLKNQLELETTQLNALTASTES